MIGTIVSIGPSDTLDRSRASTVAEKAGPVFEGMPGLRSKVFMWDEQAATVTNVYVWQSEEAARAFFTPDLVQQVIELYGVEPRVQFTEVSALVDNGAAVTAVIHGESRGGHSTSGVPISQWCPNGSSIRPSSQPCARSAGWITVAPRAAARSITL